MALTETSHLAADVIKNKIASVEWYHSVEILPGVIAPGRLPKEGRYDVESYIQQIQGNVPDFQSARILEIATWDGPVAYKLRSLEVDVVACDIQNPDKTGFNTIGEITGLDVPYHRCSVYELDEIFEAGEFDAVLFWGVFYHLRHPLLAFEKIRQVLKPGGVVLTAGSGLHGIYESYTQEPISAENTRKLQEYASLCEELNIPVCFSYPGKFINGDNWFMPSRAALESWLVGTGFEVIWSLQNNVEGGPLLLHAAARKLQEGSIQEHYLVGEEGEYTSKIRLSPPTRSPVP